jgi:Tfp pilus assembly protein PilN
VLLPYVSACIPCDFGQSNHPAKEQTPIALYAQLIEQLRQEIAALTTVDAAKDAVFSRYERTRSAFRDEIARLSTA